MSARVEAVLFVLCLIILLGSVLALSFIRLWERRVRTLARAAEVPEDEVIEWWQRLKVKATDVPPLTDFPAPDEAFPSARPKKRPTTRPDGSRPPKSPRKPRTPRKPKD